MKGTADLQSRQKGAILGMFIGDALAMPVHWYYDRQALYRDYGHVTDYQTPRNPHPDSILWRSVYNVTNWAADILHDQRRYWGQHGIHYHQFLKAGENTLNLKLCALLIDTIVENGVRQRCLPGTLHRFYDHPRPSPGYVCRGVSPPFFYQLCQWKASTVLWHRRKTYQWYHWHDPIDRVLCQRSGNSPSTGASAPAVHPPGGSDESGGKSTLRYSASRSKRRFARRYACGKN